VSSVEAVKEALTHVNDPALGFDIVSAGMVEDVTLDDGKATIHIRLTTPACPSRDTIGNNITDVVGAMAGVSSVDVRFTAEVRPRASQSAGAKLPGVRNIIAVAAGKGGVGKSTVTTNLAAALHRHGARVGILDADIYGPSIPQMMGDPDILSATGHGGRITPAVHMGIKVISVGFFLERGNPVIWRGPMIHKLLQQFLDDVDWGELDYLMVDLAPGTGDTQLSLSQLVPITGAVMVTTPQEISIIDVEKAISMWKRVEVPILGVVENMSYYHCTSCGHDEPIFARGGGKQLAEREKVEFFGEIPIVSAIRGGGDSGKPLTFGEPDSAAAQNFMAIAGRVACAVSRRNVPTPGSGVRSSKLAMIR